MRDYRQSDNIPTDVTILCSYFTPELRDPAHEGAIMTGRTSQPNVYTQAMGQDDKLFRLLIEHVADYAIFMLDPQGRVMSWNVGAEALKGYRAEEILGKHFACFYPEAERRLNKPAQLLAIAARNGRVEDEGWRVRKDGSQFWANVVITALHDESSQLRGFAKVTRDLTERRRAEEALRQANEQLERRAVERTQELQEVNRKLERQKEELQEKIDQLEKFHDVVVGRELKMIKLEKDIKTLQEEVEKLKHA
jgi:PAS domain S-box-containing protein